MLLALDAWACTTLAERRVRWPGLYIISGHRSAPVVGAFSPTTAAATASRHLFLPSLAADLRVGNAPASVTPLELWTFLGLHWERIGGRWGGRFDPPDPNHFDIDPLLAGRGLELPRAS